MDGQQLGLKRPPFGSTETFPGPQQLAVVGGLKRALVAPDSVIVVSGPAGVGKTVSVQHALERIEGQTSVASIGRNFVRREDLLEFLLDRLGMDQKPASTSRRVDALHQIFHTATRSGCHLFILVEDAERLGEDALAELESLTAADGGNTPGAHLILQGYDGVDSLLASPKLARLRQRMRRQMTLTPFSSSETRAYIDHAIRGAGGDPDAIFDDAACDVIHEVSGGIARIINNVGEALIYAAADSGVGRISGELARKVAAEDFGLAPTSVDAADDHREANSGAASEAEIPDLIGDTGTVPAPPLRHYSKESDAADTQTMKALNDALRPDTALLKSLDPVGDAGTENIPVLAPATPNKVAPPAVQESTQRLERPPLSSPPAVNEPRPGSESATARVAARPAASPVDAAQLKPSVAAKTPDPATRSAPSAPSPALPPSAPADSDAATTASAARPSVAAEPAAQPPRVSLSQAAKPSQLGGLPEPVRKPAQETQATALDRPAPQPSMPVAEASKPDPVSTSAPEATAVEPSATAPTAIASGDQPAARKAAVVSPTKTAQAIATPRPGLSPAAESATASPETAPVDELQLEQTASRIFDGNGEPQTVTAPKPMQKPLPEQSPPHSPQQSQAQLPDALPTSVVAPSPAASAPAQQPVNGADDQDASDEDPFEVAITLDDSLQQHQQEAQALVAEKQAHTEAARQEPGDSNAPDAEAAADAERMAKLSERIREAKSLEDIMDDTAAETLFGEEFTAIAAAITNAADANPGKESASPTDGKNAATVEVSEPTAAESHTVELSLEADPKPASTAEAPAVAESTPAAVAQQRPVNGGNSAAAAAKPESASAAVAQPANPGLPPQPAANGHAAAAAGPGSASAAAASPPVTSPGNGSPGALPNSAAERLRMVRELNQKAGKAPPPMPDQVGEAIVLGETATVSTQELPAPGSEQTPPATESVVPIEDQFGESMTAKLKALSADAMAAASQDGEEAPRKKGLLSRFRRS